MRTLDIAPLVLVAQLLDSGCQPANPLRQIASVQRGSNDGMLSLSQRQVPYRNPNTSPSNPALLAARDRVFACIQLSQAVTRAEFAICYMPASRCEGIVYARAKIVNDGHCQDENVAMQPTCEHEDVAMSPTARAFCDRYNGVRSELSRALMGAQASEDSGTAITVMKAVCDQYVMEAQRVGAQSGLGL